MRRLTALLLAALATLLTACGGGNDDDTDQPTPRVDCAKEPEKCK